MKGNEMPESAVKASSATGSTGSVVGTTARESRLSCSVGSPLNSNSTDQVLTELKQSLRV